MKAEPRPNQTFNLLLSFAFAIGVLAFYLWATPKFIDVHRGMGGPLWPTTAFLFQHYQSLAFVPLIGAVCVWSAKRLRGIALALCIALSMVTLAFMIGAAYFLTVHGWPHEVESVE